MKIESLQSKKWNMRRFKIYNILCFIVAINIVSINSVKAQDTLSLEKALLITLDENINIKIKTNELNQVKNYQQVGIINTLPKLRINGSVSGNDGNSSLEFATDDFPTLEDAESQSTNIVANVEFSYSIFNGLGSIYTYQKLKKQSDLKSTELLLKIEQILIKTAKQYYDIAYLQEHNKILEEVLKISRERYNRVKVQNDFGNASKLDLLSAEIDLNKDSVVVINSRQELYVAKTQLNQTLNRESTYNFSVDNAVKLNSKLTYDELKEEVLNNNNNIIFQEYLLEIAEKDKKINSVSVLPRINLSAQYGYNKNESNTSIILNQENIGISAFVNFSWDIFNSVAKKKIIQNTKIEIATKKLELTAIQQEIQKEFNTTFQQYSNSINLIELEKINKITSDKFFERAKNQFYRGQLSRTDFRLAQLELSISKNRLNQTLYSAKIAELNLFRLSGRILDNIAKH